jgi:hypothetical protein
MSNDDTVTSAGNLVVFSMEIERVVHERNLAAAPDRSIQS